MSKNPQPLTARQELLLAAEVVRARGWNDGPNLDLPATPAGPVCLMQALAVVRGRQPDDWSYVHPPKELVRICRNGLLESQWPDLAHAHADRMAVTDWNDLVCDGGEGAVRALEQAAEECR